MQTDKCISFYLQGGIIKGHFCRLSNSLTSALKNHNYPEKINKLLAEMAAMSQCFTMDIKSESQVTMQLTGTSPVKLALVNSLNNKSFRCCARFNNDQQSDISEMSLPQLFGQDGKLVFTVDFEKQQYQTIVDLSASSLQDCFQHYFIQSQQIQTIVLLCSSAIHNKTESAALLLQKLPSSSIIPPEEEAAFWHETSCFASTIKPMELLSTGPSMDNLLRLVFSDLSPVVSRETQLAFECTCSHEKIVNILKNFNTKEDNQPFFEVVCEYCNKKYRVDKNEIAF